MRVKKLKIVFTKDASENEALCRNPTIFVNVEAVLDDNKLSVNLSDKDSYDYDLVVFQRSNIVAVYFKY